MPNGSRRRLARLALLGTVLLLGCVPAENLFSPHRPKSTLLSGPNVLVRIMRKTRFNQLEFAWGTAQVKVLDGNGEPIALPEGADRIWLTRVGERLNVAFERPQPGALRGATTFDEVQLRMDPAPLAVFRLTLPELDFRRAYEAQDLRCVVRQDQLIVISRLPLELYLARVLPSEMDPDHFTLEALKAQAVVARTWALANLSRHGRFGYNFCDGPHCQVYKGRKQISSRAEQAVKLTQEVVLTYHGHLAEAFYHSTCGGNTVNVDELWGGSPLPYLARVEDRFAADQRPYCAHSPFAQWSATFPVQRLERLLQDQGVIAPATQVQNVQVDFVNRSGRVRRLLITTNSRQFTLDADYFTRAMNQNFGLNRILSKFFELEVENQQVRVRGKGLGHGVGLCQWGARGMAQHGFDYPAILKHYFSGTELQASYGVPVSSTPTSAKPSRSVPRPASAGQ